MHGLASPITKYFPTEFTRHAGAYRLGPYWALWSRSAKASDIMVGTNTGLASKNVLRKIGKFIFTSRAAPGGGQQYFQGKIGISTRL